MIDPSVEFLYRGVGQRVRKVRRLLELDLVELRAFMAELFA